LIQKSNVQVGRNQKKGSQSLSSRPNKELLKSPGYAERLGRLALVMTKPFTISSSLCWDIIICVFRKHVSKQLHKQRNLNFMYHPPLPASASKTQAFTLNECVEINFNSSKEILGMTTCITKW